MGDYATTTSISRLLPTYLKGNTTTVDTVGRDAFSAHITRAESIVNSAIGRRYALPFVVGTTTTDVPPILRTISEDIACFYALRHSFNQDGKIKNPYLESYESAIDLLKEIGAGKMPLTYTDGTSVPMNSTGLLKSSTRNRYPIFGLDDATSWARDPDEISDTEATRDQ